MPPSANLLAGLRGVREPGGVGAQPCDLPRYRLQGLVPRLGADSVGGGSDQVFELVERGRAAFDGAIAGDAQCSDRLNDSGGVFRGDLLRLGERPPGGVLRVERIGFPRLRRTRRSGLFTSTTLMSWPRRNRVSPAP